MSVKSDDPTALLPRLPASDPTRQPPVGTWTPTPNDRPAPPERLDAPWLRTVAWAVPMLLMGIMGGTGVNSPGLWEDELVTWGLVTASWDNFWAVLRNIDASIGPYYLLMRLWVEVAGTSDAMLRMPSVAAMACAAGLLGSLGSQLFGRRVGLTAGVLFAVLPATSRYAQEARPYALTIAGAVLATYLLVRLLDRPTVPRHLAYAVAVALLGLSHVVALLLLGAHALVVWKMRERAGGLFGWLAAAISGVLPVLPVLYLGWQQTNAQISWIPPVTLQRVTDTPETLFGDAVLAGAILALALLAMTMRKPTVVATAWALVPAAGLLAVSEVAPMWVSRYLLFSVPAWVLLAALGLRRLPVLRGIAAVVAIGLMALPIQVDIRGSFGHQQATKDIAAVLKVHAQPDDAIVYGPFTAGDQRTSRDAVMRYVPADRRPADRLMKRPPRTAGSFGALECPDREVAVCLGTPQRVWVVRKGALEDPLVGMGEAKATLLRTDYSVERLWHVKGFTIAILKRMPER